MFQQAVVPETVPSFCVVYPFAEDALARCPLDYPFWLKPVKSASSHRGFRVHNEVEVQRSLAAIRAGIDHFAVPFSAGAPGPRRSRTPASPPASRCRRTTGP